MIRRAALLLVAAGLALTACGAASTSAPSSRPSGLDDRPADSRYDGFGLTPPLPRPSFTLTSTSGAAVRFGTATAGRPTLLFFGYTHCPDECPTTMADMAQAIASVPSGLRSRTTVVFVTTDPRRDTGPVIARWLAPFAAMSHGARFVGLTGSQAQIDAAQAAARVPIATDGGETHSTSVLLYGPDDYAHVSFAVSSGEQAAIAHDLPLIAGS